MRTLLTTLFVSVLIFVACKKDDSPEPPPPPPPPPPAAKDSVTPVTTNFKGFADVWFTSQQTGFVLGVDVGTGIYRTLDEGKTWTKVASGDYINLFFLNAQYGYAQGRDFAYTADGGATWVVRNSGSPAIYDLSFTTPSTGYMIDANGLFKSADTGKTWQRISSGGDAFFFSDVNIGWKHSSDTLYKTTDGGTTWVKAATVLQNFGWPATIQFTDAQHGRIMSGTRFYKTDDGGTTWTQKTLSTSMYDLHFVSNDVGFVTNLGEVFKTTDGGNTWTSRAKTSDVGIIELHFTNEKNGWACSQYNVLYQLKQ